MKITFIDPPNFLERKNIERVFGCTYSHYPIPNIFILQAAAVFEEAGFIAKYIDAPVLRWSLKDTVEFLKGNPSDVYCFYTVNLAKKIDLYFLEKIRTIYPEKLIIFFGPTPTYAPTDFLRDENTIVVRGEPELTMKELAHHLLNGKDYRNIKGISLLSAGSVMQNEMRPINEDLDSLPLPARHILLCRERYYNPKLNRRLFTAVIISRGCPYQCRYCVPCSLSFARELENKKFIGSKPKVRMRSIQNAIEEFSLLKKQGYKAISFLDDQFIWDTPRLEAISNQLAVHKFLWGCLARPDHINEDVARILKSTGCNYIDIGVESFQQSILDDIHKDLKVEECLEAVSVLRKYNINFKLNILLGSSPLETKETIRYNLKVIKKIKPYAVMFSICNPFPGTEFWDMAKNNHWLIDEEYVPVDVQKESTINYPHLTRGDLEKEARLLNLRFYLSFYFLFNAIKRIFIHPKDIINGIISLSRKIF